MLTEKKFQRQIPQDKLIPKRSSSCFSFRLLPLSFTQVFHMVLSHLSLSGGRVAAPVAHAGMNALVALVRAQVTLAGSGRVIGGGGSGSDPVHRF